MDGFTEALLKDNYREQQHLSWLLQEKDQHIADLEKKIQHLEATISMLQHEGYRSARRNRT